MKNIWLASRLKHRMTLQEQVQAADGYGGYTSTWQDVASVWGEMIPVGGAPYFGKEYTQGGALHGLTRYKITLRYRANVNTAMRLLAENKTLRILAVVEPIGNKRTLEILAEEHLS